MTGNVAQVYVSDEDWLRTLNAVRSCLRPGGWLVFETRRPEARAWEGCHVEPIKVELPGGKIATVSRTVTGVTLPLATFVSETVIDGERLSSTSTLRFRELHELERDLPSAGFEVVDVRGAPDRPGLEHVFIARANY